MLSKSLIQFSVDGQGYVPSQFFDLKPNYGGGNGNNGTSFNRSSPHTASLSAPNPADPRLHQRLLDTHRHIRVSVFWGHCPFLLGAGAHKVLFILFKNFPSPV